MSHQDGFSHMSVARGATAAVPAPPLSSAALTLEAPSSSPLSADQLSLAQSFLLQDPVHQYHHHVSKDQHHQLASPSQEPQDQQQNFQYQQYHQTNGSNFQQGSGSYGDLMFSGSYNDDGESGGGFVNLINSSNNFSGSASEQQQGSLAQLEQNLMAMLQQQQQDGASNGSEQKQKQQQQVGKMGMTRQDSEDMLAQYRQLFGPIAINISSDTNTDVDGNFNNKNDGNNTTNFNHFNYQMAQQFDDDQRQEQQLDGSSIQSSSSNRIFLGTRVKPLSTSSGGGGTAAVAGGSLGKESVSRNGTNDLMKRYGQQHQPHEGLYVDPPTSSMPQQQQPQTQLLNVYMLQQQQHQQFIPDQRSEVQLSQSPVPENFGLPSTMLPPSVMISMLPPDTSSSHRKNIPVKAGKTVVKPRKRRNTKYGIASGGSDDASEEISPQQIFEEILDKHGYNRNFRLKADDSGYDAVPSPLQLASFGTQLVKAVHASDSALLSKLLSCGLSPNPCNQFRDSILDLVCKRANETIYECLLERGTDLQVVDGFGRTPLHHCCWASSFSRKIVESILDRDPIQIFMEDKHGQTPLEYVRTDLAGEWIDFLEEIATKVWPVGGQSPRLLSPKDRRPDGNLVDPQNAVSVSLAAMVSSGSITPEQVEVMDEESKKNFQS